MAEFDPLGFDGPGRIVQADNLRVLRALPDASVDLIYADPPFNTGRVQRRRTLRVRRDPAGGAAGFGGARYAREETGSMSYDDRGGDYLAWLRLRLEEARRALAPAGSLLLHLDCREVHYAKVMLDGIFGRDSFLNEIVWAYDYGARSRKRWSRKHDNILWYARDPANYTYRYDDIDRIPYLAPGLVGKEKAARGKTPTDVWWQTIVPTNGREKTGYPTQKPLAVPGALRAGALEPGRPAAGLLRRQRQLGRGGREARPALPAGRQQPGGGGGDAEAPGALRRGGGAAGGLRRRETRPARRAPASRPALPSAPARWREP